MRQLKLQLGVFLLAGFLERPSYSIFLSPSTARTNLPHKVDKEASNTRIQRWIFNAKGSSAVDGAMSLRGGALSSLYAKLSTTTAGCWVVLVFAVVIDTLSATLMKIAQKESNTQKLVLSYFGYFLR